MTLALIVAILVWGFVIGALARFALPGPDPMPLWQTTAFGLGGSVLGGIVARLLFGAPGGFFGAFFGALLLLILYRRYVQHRPVWGPGAKRPPT